MELDLIEKIVIAVACPVFASALLVTFYATQHRWERKRDKAFWVNRNADWIDGGGK